MTWVDLHLHTHYSDGSDAPERVVERAAAAGMRGLAITDHDTVDGLAEAAWAAQARGLAFWNGVEISALLDGREVHVVGLGIDPGAALLQASLRELRQLRRDRHEKMMKRLAGLGFELSLPPLPESGPGSLVGRMHIARRLQELGVTRTVQEGFDRFLKPGCPAFAPKRLIPVAAALESIHAAKGLAFVGHPGLGKGLMGLLPRLLELPFDGVEAWHVSHGKECIRRLCELAQARGLLVSGGSDCHGSIKGNPPEMGKVRVPWEAAARIGGRLGG